jgi:hypothetical protein
MQSYFYIVPCPIFILEMPKKWAKPFLPILNSYMKDWMSVTNKPNCFIVVNRVADNIRALHFHIDLNVGGQFFGFEVVEVKQILGIIFCGSL